MQDQSRDNRKANLHHESDANHVEFLSNHRYQGYRASEAQRNNNHSLIQAHGSYKIGSQGRILTHDNAGYDDGYDDGYDAQHGGHVGMTGKDEVVWREGRLDAHNNVERMDFSRTLRKPLHHHLRQVQSLPVGNMSPPPSPPAPATTIRMERGINRVTKDLQYDHNNQYEVDGQDEGTGQDIRHIERSTDRNRVGDRSYLARHDFGNQARGEYGNGRMDATTVKETSRVGTQSSTGTATSALKDNTVTHQGGSLSSYDRRHESRGSAHRSSQSYSMSDDRVSRIEADNELSQVVLEREDEGGYVTPHPTAAIRPLPPPQSAEVSNQVKVTLSMYASWECPELWLLNLRLQIQELIDSNCKGDQDGHGEGGGVLYSSGQGGRKGERLKILSCKSTLELVEQIQSLRYKQIREDDYDRVVALFDDVGGGGRRVGSSGKTTSQSDDYTSDLQHYNRRRDHNHAYGKGRERGARSESHVSDALVVNRYQLYRQSYYDNVHYLLEDTMEHVVYHFFEDKYGLQSLAVRHIASFLYSLKTYANKQIKIQLFLKCFLNDIDEYYCDFIATTFENYINKRCKFLGKLFKSNLVGGKVDDVPRSDDPVHLSHGEGDGQHYVTPAQCHEMLRDLYGGYDKEKMGKDVGRGGGVVDEYFERLKLKFRFQSGHQRDTSDHGEHSTSTNGSWTQYYHSLKSNPASRQDNLSVRNHTVGRNGAVTEAAELWPLHTVLDCIRLYSMESHEEELTLYHRRYREMDANADGVLSLVDFCRFFEQYIMEYLTDRVGVSAGHDTRHRARAKEEEWDNLSGIPTESGRRDGRQGVRSPVVTRHKGGRNLMINYTLPLDNSWTTDDPKGQFIILENIRNQCRVLFNKPLFHKCEKWTFSIAVLFLKVFESKYVLKADVAADIQSF